MYLSETSVRLLTIESWYPENHPFLMPEPTEKPPLQSLESPQGSFVEITNQRFSLKYQTFRQLAAAFISGGISYTYTETRTRVTLSLHVATVSLQVRRCFDCEGFISYTTVRSSSVLQPLQSKRNVLLTLKLLLHASSTSL